MTRVGSLVVALSVAVTVHAAEGASPQLPNAAVFGQPTSEPIRLLREKQAGDVEPLTVRIDPRCGRYWAMDALYPPEVSEAAAKTAVATLYGSEKLTSSGKPAGMWRVEAQRLSILLTVEKEGFNKGSVHLFFHFIGADPCTGLDGDPPKD